MRSKLNSNKVRCLAAIVFMLLIAMPVVVQFSHLLEDHVHQSCGDITTHLHEKKLDCDFQDFQCTNYDFTVITDTKVDLLESLEKPGPHYISSFNSHNTYNLYQRGPPISS